MSAEVKPVVIPHTTRVGDIEVETTWKRGDRILWITIRCPDCGRVKAKLSALVVPSEADDPQRPVRWKRPPAIILDYGSATLAVRCSCGRTNRGYVTIQPGYPPKIEELLDGRWTCPNQHPGDFLGTVDQVKGRVYLRCCGKDRGFTVNKVLRAGTGLHVYEAFEDEPMYGRDRAIFS